MCRVMTDTASCSRRAGSVLRRAAPCICCEVMKSVSMICRRSRWYPVPLEGALAPLADWKHIVVSTTVYTRRVKE